MVLQGAMSNDEGHKSSYALRKSRAWEGLRETDILWRGGRQGGGCCGRYKLHCPQERDGHMAAMRSFQRPKSVHSEAKGFHPDVENRISLGMAEYGRRNRHGHWSKKVGNGNSASSGSVGPPDSAYPHQKP